MLKEKSTLDPTTRKQNHSIIILLLFLMLLGIYYLVNNYLDKLEKVYSKPVTFTFELPLPEKILQHYELKNQVEIEKVVIAGEFSNWEPGARSAARAAGACPPATRLGRSCRLNAHRLGVRLLVVGACLDGRSFRVSGTRARRACCRLGSRLRPRFVGAVGL